MSTLYPAGDYPVTPNLGLALWDFSETVAENFLIIDAAISSSSGFPKNIVSVSSNYSANPGDFVECDTSLGGFTVTLPLSASNAKATIVVKKISTDTHTLTIACSGSDTLDGNATSPVNIPQTAVESTADGITSWRIY